jgi:hypothetical protein
LKLAFPGKHSRKFLGAVALLTTNANSSSAKLQEK